MRQQIPMDPAGQLVNGTKLNGVADLRNALVKYSPQFVRVVTEKLMIYALGRGTVYYDMPRVRAIVHSACSLVIDAVKSQPIQGCRRFLNRGVPPPPCLPQFEPVNSST